jgi:outer membrane protein TolC
VSSIGKAVSDLYPRFALVGDIGLAAEHLPDLPRGNSVQDAAFQALLSDYENLVLRAQGEVEQAVADLVGAQRQL